MGAGLTLNPADGNTGHVFPPDSKLPPFFHISELHASPLRQLQLFSICELVPICKGFRWAYSCHPLSKPVSSR
jgi:hypothetical protein